MKTQLIKIFTTIVAITVLTSCGQDEIYLGEVQTQSFEQAAFSKVALETLGEITLHESSEYKVEIRTNLALFDNFHMRVVNDELVLEADFTNREQRSARTIQIDIYAPTYSAIKMTGVSDLSLPDGIEEDHLDLTLSGVGRMDIRDINVNSVNVVQHGVGSISISGTAQTAEYRMHATGEIAAFGLETRMVKARVTGIGDIELTALDELDVTIQGIGNVYYRGNPTIQKSINGIGKLINAN